jgi:group I intron endonuclease
MIIYKITNKVNGKVYIGQTIRSLNTRFKEHCKKPRCIALHSAINEYGRNSFEVSILEKVKDI